MRRFFIPLLVLMLTGCLPTPAPEPTPTAPAPYRITLEENSYAPQGEDFDKQIATVTLTSVNLSERADLTPPRVVVGFLGSMPSVCNELRINVEPPDEQFRIFIEVYSLINPDIPCDRVFQQFEASILLGTYSSGRYTIWINESPIGDFVTY